MSKESKSDDEWINTINGYLHENYSLDFIGSVFYLMNKNLNRTIESINNYYHKIWRYPGLLNTQQLICSGYIRINCNNKNKNYIYNNKVINIINNYYGLSIKKERQGYIDITKKVKYIENDYWYPISKIWWNTWINYTQYGINKNDIPGGYMYMENRKANKPGKIDNHLLQDISCHNPKLLKLNTKNNVDYIWIHEIQWNYLYELYSGGPAFPRILYKENGLFTFGKTLQGYNVILIDPHSGDINTSKSNVEYICPDVPLNINITHACISVYIYTYNII